MHVFLNMMIQQKFHDSKNKKDSCLQDAIWFSVLPLGNGEVCTSCENQASEKQPKFTRRSKKNTVKKW